MAGIKAIQGTTTYNAAGAQHPAPISVEENVLIYLSFTGTTTTYQWSLTRPSGSKAVISSADSHAPSFTPDIAGGSYAVTLVDDAAITYTLDIVSASTATPVFFSITGSRYHIGQFGAVPGAGADAGVTNLAAINAAAVAANAAGGGRVYIPGGYSIGGGSIVGQSNVYFEGDNPGGSIITQLTAGTEYINWTDKTKFGAMHLKFTGATEAHGLHFKTTSVDCNDPLFENVNVAGWGGPGVAVTVAIATGVFTRSNHGFVTDDMVTLTAVAGPKATFLDAPTFTASNDRITIPNHGLSVNDPIAFNDRDNGQLATIGITTRAVYFVKSVVDSNTITISATSGGTTTDILFDSSGQSIVAWGVIPGDLDPQLFYFVNKIDANTFKLSLTRGGSTINSYSRIPSGTLKIAKVYAGIYNESAGRNIYNTALQDCNIDGGIGNLGDGGGRVGYLQDTTSGGLTQVGTRFTRGSIHDCNKGAIYLRGGEAYGQTHCYNVIDGSGGGHYIHGVASYSVLLINMRFESDHAERLIYLGSSTFNCIIEGTKIGNNWQITNSGAGNTILIGQNGAAVDLYGIVSHFIAGLYAPYLRESVAAAGVELNGTTFKTDRATYPNTFTNYTTSSAGAHVWRNPNNTGNIFSLQDGTSHGGLIQGNADKYDFVDSAGSSHYLTLILPANNNETTANIVVKLAGTPTAKLVKAAAAPPGGSLLLYVDP